MDSKELLKKYNFINEEKLKSVMLQIKNKEQFLFAMSGKMAAGKDTIGDALSELLTKEYSKTIQNVSFGGLIRQEIDDTLSYYKNVDRKQSLEVFNASLKDVETLYSIIKDQSAFVRSEESRKALQFWGTEVRRKQDPNYWINRMFEYIINTISENVSINITDARFPNEVDLIEDLGGKVIRLEISRDLQKVRIKERDGIEVEDSALDHISETILDNYVFKRKFDNSRNPEIVIKECYDFLMS